MSTNPKADACTRDSGCVVPSEFVRLRYFFGQRLGVLELSDEQAYMVGKQRFHNQRMHGTGVLCGLHGERYAPADQGSTTLLRVSSGAAIDGCGREVVVGWDSCIDVAAWVRQNRADNPDLADPQQPSAQQVWVVLCYQECPSDPAPAPRDPCGCESGGCGSDGCENGRLREGFRLGLVTRGGLPVPAGAAPCPMPPTDPCLVLARIDLVIDADGEVTDLAAVDHAIAERLQLWSTATLQAVLATVVDVGDLTAALAGGPRFGPIAFTGANATDGTLIVPVLLADDSDGSPAPILGDSTAGTTFMLRRLDNGNWQAALSSVLNWNAADAQFELVFSGDLSAGRYRLATTVADDTPIVDTLFRELFPHRLARWFELELVADVLALSNPSI